MSAPYMGDTAIIYGKVPSRLRSRLKDEIKSGDLHLLAPGAGCSSPAPDLTSAFCGRYETLLLSSPTYAAHAQYAFL
ncbi:hypothetical protein N7468_009734 [Penicillium chermesinum]|uniref:Uncharacterized protein n=1 Tax=Penicillium chermesinum TaxID=63820 RepID=A0A9W9NIF2_9EURO|nr:uncharacterized protein N7468_009734 [Penicillium chermesinum]KAJ5220530.1 hypothetical protein N7468_009734 [Penicillium chermesinum]